MLIVVNKDGSEVAFDKNKIIDTLHKDNEAMRAVNPQGIVGEHIILVIATRLYDRCRKRPGKVTVAEISDMIETELMKEGAYRLAKMRIVNRCAREQEDTRKES